MQSAFSLMELEPIEFTDALAFLQGLIDERVRVIANVYGQFFGIGFQGRLESVQTLPPDGEAIRLILEGGHGLFLDPAAFTAHLAAPTNDSPEWLELRTTFGVTLTIETSA